MAAARAAMAHVIGLGHRRLGLISGRPFERIPFRAPRERQRGFLLALRDARLPWDRELEVSADFTAAGAHRAARSLLDRPDRPTAVLAESDEMAFGVMTAARGLGLQIPEDLSVVGIDDHDVSAPMGLTTVAQPVRTLGELAALQLAGMIADHTGSAPSARVVVPTMLVVRATSAPPGQARPAPAGRRRGR